jgi:hypothetical protein
VIEDELEQLHCVIIDTVLKTPSMLAPAPLSPGSEPPDAMGTTRKRRATGRHGREIEQ